LKIEPTVESLPRNQSTLNWRYVTPEDISILVDLNRQLQSEEGSEVMSTTNIRRRLTKWLSTDYQAVVFEQADQLVAYALYRDGDTDAEGKDVIYLRQFFVVGTDRRQGIGSKAFDLLLNEIWPLGKRILLEVLSSNPAGKKFWRSLGFEEYRIKLEYKRGAK
jgi:ribosomal protein S18 acetylase RimI-like enzyme